MVEKIVIVGAGGFGREILAHIRSRKVADSEIEVLGFIDNNNFSPIDDMPVLGDDNWALTNIPATVGFICAIGDPERRKEICERWLVNGFHLVSYFHQPQNILGKCYLGKGTLVCAGAILTAGVITGKSCIVNLNVTVGHDVSLGDYVTLHPGCHVNGGVSIGAESQIGTGAIILPGIQIGEKAVIAAGAVVTQKVGKGEKVAGVPAKKI